MLVVGGCVLLVIGGCCVLLLFGDGRRAGGRAEVGRLPRVGGRRRERGRGGFRDVFKHLGHIRRKETQGGAISLSEDPDLYDPLAHVRLLWPRLVILQPISDHECVLGEDLSTHQPIEQPVRAGDLRLG